MVCRHFLEFPSSIFEMAEWCEKQTSLQDENWTFFDACIFVSVEYSYQIILKRWKFWVKKCLEKVWNFQCTQWLLLDHETTPSSSHYCCCRPQLKLSAAVLACSLTTSPQKDCHSQGVSLTSCHLRTRERLSWELGCSLVWSPPTRVRSWNISKEKARSLPW